MSDVRAPPRRVRISSHRSCLTQKNTARTPAHHGVARLPVGSEGVWCVGCGVWYVVSWVLLDAHCVQIFEADFQ